MNTAHTTVVLVLLCLIFSGCAASKPARFYTLSAQQGGESDMFSTEQGKVVNIAVRPVEIPAYLDRPQIVSRIDPNELQLSEFDQWAEPLQDSLDRILVQNLSSLLRTEDVFVFPWKGGRMDSDYQIAVNVMRFDGSPARGVCLIAQWFISDGPGKTVSSGQVQIEKLSEGNDLKALVATKSRGLAELCNRIAREIVKQIRQ